MSKKPKKSPNFSVGVKRLFLFGQLGIIVSSVFVISYLVAYAATYVSVPNGGHVNTDQYIGGVKYCKGIYNNTGVGTLFVPLNTRSEIDTFLANRPAGVTVYDGKSDYSDGCCHAGSYCSNGGWNTYNVCASKIDPGQCYQNGNGCYGPC